jgi:hypothetical protein
MPECDAPAVVAYEYTLGGAGFGPPGTETIVSMARMQCAAGHHYDAELSSVEMSPMEEPTALANWPYDPTTGLDLCTDDIHFFPWEPKLGEACNCGKSTWNSWGRLEDR